MRYCMDTEELLKNDMRKRIKQINYIIRKTQLIPRYYSNTTLKLFLHRMDKRKKYYENALNTAGGWIPFNSISKSEHLTNSIIVGQRLEVFAFEVEFERLALRYHSGFFGFYHPESFKLFGINEQYVYDKGVSNGVRIPAYDTVRSAIQNDPSLILREREKVTAYLKRGWETCVSKRQGENFPIDLTIPEGY